MCVGMVTVLPVFVSLRLFSLSAKHTCRSRHGAYACYGWCYWRERRPAGVAARCFYFSNAAHAAAAAAFSLIFLLLILLCFSFFAFVCLNVWGCCLYFCCYC